MTRIKHLANPEQVPKPTKQIFDDIVACTDDFCGKNLNANYALLLRKLTATLCRKRPSPLFHGNLQTWTAGMVHAIGMINFLFDKSQKPYMSSSDLCACFSLAQSTVSNKSKQIRNLLRMSQSDANWMLPERIEESSMAWMVLLDDFIVDARRLPLEIQEEAVRKGLIPYVPAYREEERD